MYAEDDGWHLLQYCATRAPSSTLVPTRTSTVFFYTTLVPGGRRPCLAAPYSIKPASNTMDTFLLLEAHGVANKVHYCL